MKQIGIAVHNFHDSLGGLPPITLGGDNDDVGRASIHLLLYPFIEQQQLYDAIRQRVSLASGVLTREGFNGIIHRNNEGTRQWWAVFDVQEQESFASVSIYRCPTRRGNELRLYTGTAAGDAPGPLGDYAAVVMASDYWFYHYRVGQPGTSFNDYSSHYGPFRVAIQEVRMTTDSGYWDFARWGLRDTMAWWRDGSSNQFLFGEKHIPSNRIGISRNGGEDSSLSPYAADYTYLASGRWAAGAARSIKSNAYALASIHDFIEDTDASGTTIQCVSSNYDNSGRSGHYGFGSWHPGACHFLFGDGAVRAFPNVTSDAILRAFAKIEDGGEVFP